MGIGAMTGRAAGFCSGFGMPGFASAPARRGFGIGFGRERGTGFSSGRRGRRNMLYATGLPGWLRRRDIAAPYGYPAAYGQPDPQMERQRLKDQAEALQSELNIIKKRISEIETEGVAD
jgi:hypothetical protein